MKQKLTKRQVRHKRVRAKILGTASKPRLSVFRSNRALTVQLLDDSGKKGSVTLAHADSFGLKGKAIEKAKALGKAIAEKAVKLKIRKVVFDRGGYAYMGKVRALAEGAREGGLEF